MVGQSAVRSSQACRLSQYRLPGSTRIPIPIRVPGQEWEGLIVGGSSGVPLIMALRRGNASKE